MTAIVPFNEEPGRTESIESLEQVATGQWYWVKTTPFYDEPGYAEKTPVEKLVCAMHIGSNFIELHGPPNEHGSSSSWRVHFDNFWTSLRFEPNADAHIQQQISRYQTEVNTLLGEVQEVTRRLGVVPTTQIADKSGEDNNALVVLSTQVDTSAYKNALVLAKETTLPDLFKAIEKAHKLLASWMIAPTLPVKATIGPMKESINAVENRIYTIELYAGLTEEAVQCCEGDPAPMGEKLRVMQRRLYMDEECLLSYTGGGIEIKDIGAFDEWISKPENRDRVLPFPRTLAAFRVRRETKEREDDGNAWRMFVNAQIAQTDKKTFLYARNGEQVWRIDCDFVFDEMIFPDKDEFNPSEPMMVKMFANRVDKMMPKGRWGSLLAAEQAKYDTQKIKHDQWNIANPEVENKSFHNPFRVDAYALSNLNEYEPFDPSNVYFDEALKTVQDQIKKYNRIAVIIQGLFDRSLVLHPHPPVKVWDPVVFESAIELVYDATTLSYGQPPDFEAYRAALNETIGPDSIVTGQEEYWFRQEAIKENKRQANDRNDRRTRANYKRYRPDGNPGPGLIAKIEEWKPRARKAVFRWTRKLQRWTRYGDPAPASVEVPASAMLNVSAYTPGDFKQFVSDHRTRADYLKWAPLMLAAEDYHAGTLALGTEGETHPQWN